MEKVASHRSWSMPRPRAFLRRFTWRVVGGVGEVDAAGEEAVAVVVGVDHPAGDVAGGATVEASGSGVEGVEAAELYLYLTVGSGRDYEVGFGQHYECLGAAVRIELADLEVAVHRHPQHADPTDLRVVGGRRVEREGGGDQHLDTVNLAGGLRLLPR